MKAIARIYKWILFSIILQLAILTYFNSYYLTHKGAVQVTSYNASEKSKVNKTIKLPRGAEQVRVSFDSSYAAYILDGQLKVMSIQSKKNKEIPGHEGDVFYYYRWLPDRNIIICSLKSPDGQASGIQITTYDVDSGQIHDYPKIKGLPKDSEVMDIELSPLTNIVYTKVKTSESSAQIYKFNIMSNLNFVMSINIGTKIKETSYSDKLVYQDSKDRIYVKDGIKGTTTKLPFKNRMALLDICSENSEDVIYIGELNKNNKIDNIHYGKIATREQTSWHEISTKKPIAPENIIIMPNGEMYEIVEGDNTINSITGSSKISYKGEFIEVVDGYIVTLDGNDLKLTVMKESLF